MLILNKKVKMATLISEKIDFKANNISKNKEDHFVMMESSFKRI